MRVILIKQEEAKNLRCIHCGKLLGKFRALQTGEVMLKCSKCKKIITFKFNKA